MPDRYGHDVLSTAWRSPKGRSQEVAASLGLVVEEVESGFVGAVVRVEKAGGVHVVHLEDRRGTVRGFELGPGFWIDGKPVTLVPDKSGAVAQVQAAKKAAGRTASGSIAVANAPAKVASGSRIFVEGKHDAELVEKVWGHDLRVEGVVVEMLDGVDDLAAVIKDFRPDADRRLGILVDHLVPGTKESRIVAEAQSLQPWSRYVKILGHPYVDVWQSVRPERLGLQAWPTIPRNVEWKKGIAAHLGWPHADQRDIAHAWKQILGTVRTYADLEPALLASVEELIDFVTVPLD